MKSQVSAQPTKCADQITYLTYPTDVFTYLKYELRILRMSYVFYVRITYILRMLRIFHPQQHFEIFKIPAADLRMSADPTD